MSLVSSKAPDFTAQSVDENQIKEISLSEFKGKWVVLFFYPLDFTFVCPTEIISFNNHLDLFRNVGSEVIGCSVDSQFSHRAWIKTPKKDGGLGGWNYQTYFS